MSFVMSSVMGKSDEQAAKALGIKVSAYKVRLSRARKKIGDYLAPRCEHIDPRNPCHCPSRIGIALQKGFIAPPQTAVVQLRAPQRPFDQEIKSRDATNIFAPSRAWRFPPSWWRGCTKRSRRAYGAHPPQTRPPSSSHPRLAWASAARAEIGCAGDGVPTHLLAPTGLFVGQGLIVGGNQGHLALGDAVEGTGFQVRLVRFGICGRVPPDSARCSTTWCTSPTTWSSARTRTPTAGGFAVAEVGYRPLRWFGFSIGVANRLLVRP